MKRETWLWMILGTVGFAYLATRGTRPAQNEVTSTPAGGSDAAGFTSDPLSFMTEAITSAVAGWKNAGQGPTWLPVLNAAEDAHALPRDLLARIAYQESRFREDIIRGNTTSSAGALGIMQMMPQYFTSVRAPRPYADGDVSLQIDEAATLVASLYAQFNDWPLAIAAYNDGAGNVRQFIAGTRKLPKQTTDYVAQVTADVPALSA